MGSIFSNDEVAPSLDAPRLRLWINQLLREGSWTLHGLWSLWREEGPGLDDSKAGLNTLRRFLHDSQSRYQGKTGRALTSLWEFLLSRSEFRRLLPGAGATRRQAIEELSPDSDELLSYALARFIGQYGPVAHKATLEGMKKMLPGRYVMYRLDMEPAASMMTPRKLVRASLIQIECSEGEMPCLRIHEIQDFPATKDRPQNSQRDTGIVIPCGEFMLAMFGARRKTLFSFKFMVIESFKPIAGELPLEMFRGKLMVSSEVGRFPSVKFACLRADDGVPHHGLYPYKAIDKDVLRWLTTYTFPGYELIS